MMPKSKNSDKENANVSHSSVPAEPWWSNMGYNSMSSTMRRASVSDSSSQEQSIDGQSHSGSKGNDEDDDSARQSQSTTSLQLDGNFVQHYSSFPSFSPNMLPRGDGSIPQPTQLELIGHSIACTSAPYSDYCFGGMVAPFGQNLVHSHLLHARMPLHLDVAQEPVYVNAKQYQGILRRRESRAKAELEKKLIKVRKPYLHESRHQHALRRARSSGGRFAKKSDVEASYNCSSSSGIHPDPESLPSHSAEMSTGNGIFGRQCSLLESIHDSAHVREENTRGGKRENRAI